MNSTPLFEVKEVKMFLIHILSPSILMTVKEVVIKVQSNIPHGYRNKSP